MAIEFRCEGCGQRLRVSSHAPGLQARCPQCELVQPIPERTDDAMQAGAAAPSANPPSGDNGHNPLPTFDPTTSNPYAPPGGLPYSSQLPIDTDLASRGKRLAGAIVDTLIHGTGMIPGALLIMISVDANEVLAMAGYVIMLGGLLVVAIGNWVLISLTGQSYAKRLLGMRIVKTSDGSLPGFVTGVVLRLWVPMLINQLCGFFSFIDVLFIFGQERQCLHDQIASTRVVEATERFSPAAYG